MTKNKKMVIIIISVLIAIVWIVGGFLLFKFLTRPKTGTEMAQKSLSQIAKDMKDDFKISIGGDKQVYSLEPTPYIYNEEKMPGYVFYLNESSENSKDLNKLKEKIAAGEYDKKYSYMGLFDDAKLNDRISADMRYSDLSNEIGKFDCGKINEKGEYGYETEVDGQRTYFTFKADKKTKAEVPDGEKVKKKYLEKINPKIHAIVVFPDSTDSSDDADKILEDKISELTEDYGIASYEEKTLKDISLESDPSWTGREGIISAQIVDLDCDGTDELVVARLKGGTLNEESDNLEIEVFFIKDGEAVTAGAEVFYTGDDFTEKRIDSFIYKIKDKNYIFVEGDYSISNSDSTTMIYTAMEYQNEELKKTISLRSESSVGDYYRWIETTWEDGKENTIYESIYNFESGQTKTTGKYKDSEHPEVDYLADFGLPETDEKFGTTAHYKYFNTKNAEQIFEYSIVKTAVSGNIECESILTDYTDVKKYDKAEKEDKTEKESEENTDTEYTAQDLMNKPVDEIAELMDNDFEIDEGQIYTMLYFHNYDKFPGMDFYVKSENNDKEAARSGILDGTIEFNAIEVTGSGKGCRYEEQIVTADMDYSQCSEIFGEVDCEPSGGRIGSGALGAVAYNYSEDELTITINFELTDTLTKLIQEEGNSTVSYDTMIEENPNVQNIIVQKKIDGEF